MPRLLQVPQNDGSFIEIEVGDGEKLTDAQIIAKFNEEPPTGLWDRAKDLGKSALSGLSEGAGDYLGGGASYLTQLSGLREPGSKALPLLEKIGIGPTPEAGALSPADQDPLSHAIANAVKYRHTPQTKAGQYAKSIAGAAVPAAMVPVGVGATAANTLLAGAGGAIAQHGTDAGWSEEAIAAGSVAPSLVGGLSAFRPSRAHSLADATFGGRSSKELADAVRLSDEATQWGMPLMSGQVLPGPNAATAKATSLYGTKAGQPLTEGLNRQRGTLDDLTHNRTALDAEKNAAYQRGRTIPIDPGDMYGINVRLMNVLRNSDVVPGTADFRAIARTINENTYGIMGTSKANATELNTLATAMHKKANGVSSRENTFHRLGSTLRDEANLRSPNVREGNRLHGLRSDIADRMENTIRPGGSSDDAMRVPGIGVGMSGNVGFNLGGAIQSVLDPLGNRKVAKVLADPEFRRFLKLTGRSRLQIAMPYGVGAGGSLSYSQGGLGDAAD